MDERPLQERLEDVAQAAGRVVRAQWIVGCPCDGVEHCSFEDLCAALKNVGYAPPS
jgi:hypothetical protein